MKYYPEININKLELYEITRINLKSVILNKSIYCMTGGSGWGGRWEGGSGWGRHVNPRPFHFNV